MTYLSRTTSEPSALLLLAAVVCIGSFSTQTANAQQPAGYPQGYGGNVYRQAAAGQIANPAYAGNGQAQAPVGKFVQGPVVQTWNGSPPAPAPAGNANQAMAQAGQVNPVAHQNYAGQLSPAVGQMSAGPSRQAIMQTSGYMSEGVGAVLSQPTTMTGPSCAACDCGYQAPPSACLGCCQPCMKGFDCACRNGKLPCWKNMYPIDFGPYAQGEYLGPSRLSHMREYRVRVGDTIQFAYVLSRDQMRSSYRLGVGDQLLIESLADETVLKRGTFERGLEIQPDGTISVRILGTIHAAGLTVDQLRDQLEEKYKKYYNEPGIDVTPVKTNILLEDIRNAIGGASGLNEQAVTRIVTPDGRIALPKVGAVCVQGLTLQEIKSEINLRYQSIVTGLEVEVGLAEQANHFIYVLGEVGEPGRFEIEAPTTVLGALALAQGQNVGANLRQVVVFRRAEDWRLISTVLDLRGAVLGKAPLPTDEIFLRDGDVVIVPSTPIRLFDNFVSQVFTEGIYGIVPFSGFDLVEAINGFEIDNNN